MRVWCERTIFFRMSAFWTWQVIIINKCANAQIILYKSNREFQETEKIKKTDIEFLLDFTYGQKNMFKGSLCIQASLLYKFPRR